MFALAMLAQMTLYYLNNTHAQWCSKHTTLAALHRVYPPGYGSAVADAHDASKTAPVTVPCAAESDRRTDVHLFDDMVGHHSDVWADTELAQANVQKKQTYLAGNFMVLICVCTYH